MVPVLFTFYIQSVLKLENNSGAKRLMGKIHTFRFRRLENNSGAKRVMGKIHTFRFWWLVQIVYIHDHFSYIFYLPFTIPAQNELKYNQVNVDLKLYRPYYRQIPYVTYSVTNFKFNGHVFSQTSEAASSMQRRGHTAKVNKFRWLKWSKIESVIH